MVMRIPPFSKHPGVSAAARSGETLGALKVVVSYAAFACLWILLSDELVAALFKDPETMTAVSIIKGSLFVGITSILLFVQVRRFGANLAESEKRFTTAFQFIPVGLAITRLDDGRILTVNEAFGRLFGYNQDQIIGRSSLELGLWDAATRARITGQLAAGEAIVNLELPAQRQDGAAIAIAYSGRLVTMQGMTCLLSVAVDITGQKAAAEERRQLEAEVQHSQKLESLGGLASGVAHDMNNVLAAVQTMVEVLLEKVGPESTLVGNLDTISRAARRGRDLVRGLTNFARKDLREPEVVDLNRIVREEAELLDRVLLQKIRLVLELEPGLPRVMGEAGTLGAALMNLCVNAVDAMPEGGTLTLRTLSRPEHGIELQVLDTGHGMAPAVVARAMEPFFTTKPTGKGTGLGLAMVHGTVKAHGGSLQVQSEPGRGTAVILRLPGLAAAVAEVAIRALPPVPVRSLELLLVDDDDLIRTSVPAMLETSGHRVTSAAGGREALVLLRAGLKPDAVILDLNMPEMGGLEALGHIHDLRPGLPVLVATGYLDSVAAERLRNEPNTLALAKPFSKAELEKQLTLLFPE
jgi:PAS domain S-box-containing protein